MASFSKTQWWSRWEVLNQLLVQFGDVELFILNNSDIGSAIRPKLLETLADTQKRNMLKISLLLRLTWESIS